MALPLPNRQDWMWTNPLPRPFATEGTGWSKATASQPPPTPRRIYSALLKAHQVMACVGGEVNASKNVLEFGPELRASDLAMVKSVVNE